MEINGYENYLIYPDGRVYNKKYNRFLKPVNCNGYLMIGLCYNNIRKNYKIHRLIGEYYIPNPDNKPCIDHIDRNPLNNDISNLRWATHKENMNNLSKRITNTSGHTNISYNKEKNKWIHQIRGHKKYFKSKIDAICYKFIYILKNKSKQ